MINKIMIASENSSQLDSIPKEKTKVKTDKIKGLVITLWIFLGVVIFLHLASVIFFATCFIFQPETSAEKIKLAVSMVTEAADNIYFFLVTIVTAVTTIYYLSNLRKE
jgi:flagellar basal body-associated protein FliL